MNMNNCPNCGQQLSDGTEFCPNCGHKINNQLKQHHHKSAKKRFILITIILVLGLGGVAFWGLASHNNSSSTGKNPQQGTSKVNSNKPIKQTKISHENKTSQSASSKTSGAMPKEYQGDWYHSKNLHFVIKPNEIDMPNSPYQKKITKDSSPLKLPAKNADGSYTINDLEYMPGFGGDDAYYWLAPMTIDGKKETVLVGVHRQGQISIDTQHPTDKNYYFISVDNDHFVDVPIGTQDIDKYYKDGMSVHDYDEKMKNSGDSDTSNKSKNSDKNDSSSSNDNDKSDSNSNDDNNSDNNSNNSDSNSGNNQDSNDSNDYND